MRPVSWVRAARKDFEAFPAEAQDRMRFALEIAAHGRMADVAKPLKGFDAGVFEIALAFRGEGYRTVYALKLGNDIWVVHAFQKKSTQGIKTPVHDIDLIRERIRRIREVIR